MAPLAITMGVNGHACTHQFPSLASILLDVGLHGWAWPILAFLSQIIVINITFSSPRVDYLHVHVRINLSADISEFILLLIPRSTTKAETELLLTLLSIIILLTFF